MPRKRATLLFLPDEIRQMGNSWVYHGITVTDDDCVEAYEYVLAKSPNHVHLESLYILAFPGELYQAMERKAARLGGRLIYCWGTEPDYAAYGYHFVKNRR